MEEKKSAQVIPEFLSKTKVCLMDGTPRFTNG